MIQRIQSVYLFVGAVILVVFGVVNLEAFANMTPLYLVAVLGAFVVAMDVLITIFLFKSRKTQLLLIKLSIVLLIAVIVCFALYLGIDQFYMYWHFYLPIVSLLCLILAHKAVYSDEQLVKSSYRLR